MVPLGHGKYNSGSRKWVLVKYSFKRQKGVSVSSALVLITFFFLSFENLDNMQTLIYPCF